MRVTQGKIHDYLGITLDYSEKNKLKVDMIEYVTNIKRKCTYQIKNEKKPWSDNLFKVDKESRILSKKELKLYHTFIIKKCFMQKEPQ